MRASRSEKRRLRVAILANDRASFVKPMADGLQRMLDRAGVEGRIFYEGLEALAAMQSAPTSTWLRKAHRAARRAMAPWTAMRDFYSVARELRHFDVVVIVSTIPKAFLRAFFCDEIVRRLLPNIPIVLYDVFYLPTRGLWGQWLREGNIAAGIPEGGNWGLERYDWYLCASVVSECPLPPGPHPCSVVGLNLDDGTLKPEQDGEFVALLDFENPEYLSERAVQVTACERSGTPFIVLNGSYSIDEIRRIYRRCSIYFVAMRESFGLPVCELQACGSYVFTPHADWCPSHWHKADLSKPGPGELSSNFVVYENNADTLATTIARVRAVFDPKRVVDTFKRNHPQFYCGDQSELRGFLDGVLSGRIHSESHRKHITVLPTESDVRHWPAPRPAARGSDWAHPDERASYAGAAAASTAYADLRHDRGSA